MAASYLSESFEGTGYENSWTVEEGSGCTIDPDNTETIPTGGGSQVLKMIGAGNGVNNDIMYSTDADKARTWATFYFRLASLTDGHDMQFVRVEDDAWDISYTLNVERSGSTYTVKISLYYNGGLQGNVDTKTISLNTWYKIDVKYDVTGTAWEWRFDDISEGSGTLSGTLTGGLRYFSLYSTAWNDGFAGTCYFDRIWIDDSEYGYAETSDYIKLIWTK